MQFTGERFIPGLEDARVAATHRTLACEHWHRYLYAARFAAGKAVLDVACGEGYGSRLLAETAARVLGVDTDPEAVRDAASRYPRPNLEFRTGTVERLPLEGEHLLDLVVSFETIEHVWAEQQRTFLGEVRRVLKPGGVLLVSTPNKLFYEPGGDPAGKNPFHRTELFYDEYLGLLKQFFAHVHVLGQKVYPASYLWPAGGPPGPVSEYQLGYSEGRFWPAATDRKEMLYLIAVCSQEPVEPPTGSLLLDVTERAFQPPTPAARQPETDRAVAELRAALEAHLQEYTIRARAQEAAAVQEKGERERALSELRAALESHLQEYTVRARGQEAADRARAEAIQELDRRTRSPEPGDAASRSAVAEFEGRVRALGEEAARWRHRAEARARKHKAVREALAERDRQAADLAAQLRLATEREQELRQMLLDAHEQLLNRDEEIQATLAEVLPQGGPQITGAIAAKRSRKTDREAYLNLVRQVREVVGEAVPEGSTVIVVSKGDDELLRLGARDGWHFPRAEDGRYAGHHPADGAAAVAHLEELRAKGGRYLVLPETARWWLDHYAEFRQYLDGRAEVAARRDGVCTVYALTGVPARNGPPARGAARPPFGVNVAGYFASEKGIGEAARATVRGLRAAAVPHAVNTLMDEYSANVERTAGETDDNPYAVNLLQLNADTVPWFAETKADYLRGRYNVGFWFWELSRFPEQEWRESFGRLDEVWTATTFAQDAIARASPVPVVRIPLAVPERLPMADRSRSHFGLPDDRFVFLFVFDFMSITGRKNPFGLVQAFRRAFRKGDPATLVLKCTGAEPRQLRAMGESPEVVRALTEAAGDLDVRVLTDVLPREDLNALIGLADCYVSLHRSEGFGLTLAEAMSLGKPVIATGYSGNTDFMTASNSYLVCYDLVELDRDHGPYRKGCVWAEPSVEHAAELMRHVFENPDAARAVGRRARRDVLRAFHPQVVGGMIRERLLRLADLGKIPHPPVGAVPAPASGSPAVDRLVRYHELTDAVREAVRGGTPDGATVLVVSKGDDELLRLGGRRAWHFPRDPDGRYAGHHPADSGEAIAQLEGLRAKGAGYLVLPATARWWLDHYADFRAHLDRRYRRAHDDESCVIYELVRPEGPRTNGTARTEAAVG
jgi:glycosyltransferase involved in cell wall biosynthesis/SAM-dependent methyltransferase